jgi:hypothetical protein
MDSVLMKPPPRPKRRRRFGPPGGGGRAGGGNGAGGGKGSGGGGGRGGAEGESFSWWGYPALMVLLVPAAFFAFAFLAVVVKVLAVVIGGHG